MASARRDPQTEIDDHITECKPSRTFPAPSDLLRPAPQILRLMPPSISCHVSPFNPYIVNDPRFPNRKEERGKAYCRKCRDAVDPYPGQETSKAWDQESISDRASSRS